MRTRRRESAGGKYHESRPWFDRAQGGAAALNATGREIRAPVSSCIVPSMKNVGITVHDQCRH
jgi:hypothetical protein